METRQLIKTVKSTFLIGKTIHAIQRKKTYTFSGISNYQSGKYTQHFGKEIFVIDTHTSSIKKANLFFEILSPLVDVLMNGAILTNKNFHSFLDGIAWIDNKRQFPDLTTFEPYYIAVASAIYKQIPLEKFQLAIFNTAIKKSENLSDEIIEKRLTNAAKKPKSIIVTSVVFKRNPDVVVAVLRRANGFCENCRNNAPFFKRTDNKPYLEVHHIVQLSEGGDDTVINAQALCPNCHRKKHFGILQKQG